MEKNVVKTIREAFKLAYLNKILKEASADLASRMDTQELAHAERLYPRWISGRLSNLRWGKENKKVENYLIEKAVEEYKQTGDKKIHDAIANFYYPNKNGLLYNHIKNTSRYSAPIIGNLRKANKLPLFNDLLFNAWTRSLGDVTKFDEIIQKYTTDSSYGIGSYLMTMFELEASALASKVGAKRRGGGSEFSSLDEPGYDSEGGRKLDLPGGIEVSDEADLRSKMYDLFKTFGNLAADFFESKGKNSLSTLTREFFVNGKSYAQILSEYPELFAGKKPGDLSTMMILQVLAPSSIKSIAKSVGKDYGFPGNWLENLISSKNISSIQDAFKGVEPDLEKVSSREGGEDDGLVFEKFLNENIERIVEEVYKRLDK